jgi:hypothetical protein
VVNSHKNKTVVDAACALQGDASNLYREHDSAKNIVLVTDKDCKYIISTGFYKNSLVSSGYFLSRTMPESLVSGVSFVCTTEEFKQCVSEMSEGLFVPDCRPKTPEIHYDKDGNGWEVGSVYEFSNDKKYWNQASFSKIYQSLSEYKPNGLNWHLFARECQSPIGKIHKKPIELVDGAAYQFEYIAGKFIGIYVKSDDLFYMSNRRTLNRERAKNIIKLVPELI